MTSIEGYIATHDNFLLRKIVFEGDTIVAIEDSGGTADHTYGKGHIIFPGFCDKHTHPREYPLPENPTDDDIKTHKAHLKKEDFESLSEAAIFGGVTRLGWIPNTPRAPKTAEDYDAYTPLTKKSKIPGVLYAMIGPGTVPFRDDIPHKFMGPSVGNDYIESDSEIPGILLPYRNAPDRRQLSVSQHCESIDELAILADRPTHEERRGFPVQDFANSMALTIQQEFLYELHIMHTSTASCVQMIAEAKKARPEAPIYTEACPHHFLMDISAKTNPELEYAGGLFMNPCLQRADDKEMIRLELGKTIEYVSSDHAGHTPEDKEKGAAGITGVHIMGPAAAELIRKYDVNPETIARIFAYNPGKFLGRYLGERIGDIKIGYKANFTVLNMRNSIKMSDEVFTPKCGWNPWSGYEFGGSVEATFVDGKKLL